MLLSIVDVFNFYKLCLRISDLHSRISAKKVRVSRNQHTCPFFYCCNQLRVRGTTFYFCCYVVGQFLNRLCHKLTDNKNIKLVEVQFFFFILYIHNALKCIKRPRNVDIFSPKLVYGKIRRGASHQF